MIFFNLYFCHFCYYHVRLRWHSWCEIQFIQRVAKWFTLLRSIKIHSIRVMKWKSAAKWKSYTHIKYLSHNAKKYVSLSYSSVQSLNFRQHSHSTHMKRKCIISSWFYFSFVSFLKWKFPFERNSNDFNGTSFILAQWNSRIASYTNYCYILCERFNSKKIWATTNFSICASARHVFVLYVRII